MDGSQRKFQKVRINIGSEYRSDTVSFRRGIGIFDIQCVFKDYRLLVRLEDFLGFWR